MDKVYVKIPLTQSIYGLLQHIAATGFYGDVDEICSRLISDGVFSLGELAYNHRAMVEAFEGPSSPENDEDNLGTGPHLFN